MSTEKTILAGGCFWGMQDLIRKLPGIITTRVGYTGGDGENATYGNHGSHAEAIEISFDNEQIRYRDILTSSSRFMTLRQLIVRVMTGDLLIDPKFITLATIRETLRLKPLKMLMARDCGPGRSQPKSHPPPRSGKQNLNIRIIWNVFRTAIPAISHALAGSYLNPCSNEL